MAIFPGAVSTDSDLYIAVNNLSALLTDNPLTIGATTVNVNSTTLFPTVGFISIDAEIIKYTGKTATSFTGCTRGADGTSAAAHSVGAQVDHNVIAAHHNVLKDEIIALETFIQSHIGLTTNVSAAEFEFVDGVTSNIQTQLNAKAPLASPIFTGVVTIPTPFTLGATSVTTTGAELNFVAGVTSAIQTQLNAKATDTLVVHLAGTETITGQKTFSLAILNQDGSAGSPAYSFSSDPDTGMFRSGANELSFATSGSRRWRILSTGDWVVEGGIASTVQVLAGSGAVGTPAYSFNVAGGSTTGMYLVTSNDLGFAAGGSLRLNINSLGLHGSAFYATQDGTVSGPIFSWDSDTDTGIWRGGTNEMDFTAGGTNCMSISPGGVILRGTNTNDNAADAFVGTAVRSFASAVTIGTTGQFKDITSISLTAGDWDVSGVGVIQPGGTGSISNSLVAISVNSNNTTTDHVNADNQITAAAAVIAVSDACGTIPVYRLSLSGTTTVYLKMRATHAGLTGATINGRISARRVR